MSYNAAQIPNLADGETGYVLDTGDYIAVSKQHQSPDRCQANTVSYVWTARWVDANGGTLNDLSGQPLVWTRSHSIPQSALVSGAKTPAVFNTEGLDLAILGSTPTVAVDPTDAGIRGKIIATKAMQAA